MAFKSKEALKTYQKRWYIENKDRINAVQRVYLSIPENREAKRQYGIKIRQNLRAAILAKYGAKCCYCGYDSNTKALQIDHVFGGGARERRISKGPTPGFLKKVLADIAGNYQILCANCNFIKGASIDKSR